MYKETKNIEKYQIKINQNKNFNLNKNSPEIIYILRNSKVYLSNSFGIIFWYLYFSVTIFLTSNWFLS